MVDKYFKRSLDDITDIKPLLWSHFIPTILKSENDPTKKIPNIYCEVTNRTDLTNICYTMLGEFNENYTVSKMNLVLFEAAIIHIIKIVRVITTTFGNALLVGVGGSGRKSLATLSTYIACDGSEPQIVNQKEWVWEL
jgi:dynein heavy chain